MKWTRSKSKKSEAANHVLATTDSQDTNEILAKEDWRKFLCSECKEMVTMGGHYDGMMGADNEDDERSALFEEAKEDVESYAKSMPATLQRWPIGIVKPPPSAFKEKIVDVIFVDQDKHSNVYAIEVCSSPAKNVHNLYAVQSLAKDTRRRRF